MPPNERTRPSRAELVALLAAVAVGAGLRVVSLGAESLWTDEVILWITARRPFLDGLLQLQDYSAPLYQLLVRPWAGGAPVPEAWLRAPAALFGALCVPAVWWLGRLGFGARVGVAAAWVVAVDPTLVEYAREARPNSLFVLLSTLSMACWLDLLRAGEGPRAGDGRRALRWAAATVALVYAHYLGALCIAAQAAHLLLRAARRGPGVPRVVWGAAAGVALASLPAAVLASRYVLEGAPGTVGWIPSLGLVGYLRVAGALVGWGEFRPGPTALGAALGGLTLLAAFAALAPGPRGADAQGSDAQGPDARQRADAAWACVLWVVFGLFGFALADAAGHPLLTVRYALPVAVALVVAALATLDRLHPAALAAGAGLLAVVGAADLPRVLEAEPGLRELAVWLERNAKPDEPVFVAEWSYTPSFVNPEIEALRYYGFDTERVARLVLDYPHGTALANPEALPEQGRALVVTFIAPARLLQPALVRRGHRVAVRRFGSCLVLLVTPPPPG